MDSALAPHARHRLVVFDRDTEWPAGRQPTLRFHRNHATEATYTGPAFQSASASAKSSIRGSWMPIRRTKFLPRPMNSVTTTRSSTPITCTSPCVNPRSGSSEMWIRRVLSLICCGVVFAVKTKDWAVMFLTSISIAPEETLCHLLQENTVINIIDQIPADGSKKIKKYRTGGGNKGRRASEASLFESGNYDATH